MKTVFQDLLIDYLRFRLKEYFKKTRPLVKGEPSCSKHEFIKGCLFEFGLKNNFLPRVEYMSRVNGRVNRIDIVWSSNGIIHKAFEIDKTVYPKSINKLMSVPEEVEKYIISMGKYNHNQNVELLSGLPIKRVNLTEETLKRLQIKNEF